MKKITADTYDHIVVDPKVLVGKPIIKGTRIPVSLILNLLKHGYAIERIQEDYPVLTEQDIQAAITYVEERINREEIRLFKDNV